MENIGEHLVGQYLQEVKECDFVQYNLQTKFVQGEIDVVAINSNTKEIFVCEVATHLETGLQYTKNGRPDNVNRFKEKFKKNIQYVTKNFNGYTAHYMLWTPIIKIPKKENAKNNQEMDLLEVQAYLKEKFNVNLELIYNDKFLLCIDQLREVALNTTSAMTSSIMRFLQIDEKLRRHMEKCYK